jgi:tetratricopeptide (TPR) repeat protein
VPPFDWLGRSRALSEAGQWRQAVTSCRYWTSEQPDNYLAWQQLGEALTKRGVSREIGQGLLAAMAQEGFTSRLSSWSSRLDLASQDDPLLEARLAFQQALRLKPDDAASWYGLGEVYLLLGDRAGVREFAAILQRYDPGRATTLLQQLNPHEPEPA